MMGTKTLIVLCCFVAAALCGGDKYTDKYDNINVQEILENRRLLLGYIDCIMERGKCTPDGKELKANMHEAIETGCEKCTETQENSTYTIIEHLINKEKAIWDEVCAKFDPTGKGRKTYEERAKAKGHKIPDGL